MVVCSTPSCRSKMAIDQFYEWQMYAAEVAAERQRVEQHRAVYEQKRGEAVC